uniref:TIR domain-containing protein n=1 Tax=Neogobius melanostomus TaxID=47308 RepID=A0A8C6UB02_9GOBI
MPPGPYLFVCLQELSQMEPLFSLLFLLLLPLPSWLYSLHNCTIDSTDSRTINCNDHKLSRIPSDIPKTAVILNVSHNNINFIQQSYFSGLTELQILDLSNNQISHIEDASFSHLSSLTVLSLIGNKLMELTDHMFTGLSNLTVLNLTENQITFVSEFVFVPLTKLLQLRLRDNRLSSISDIVKVVSFCPLLKFLDLSNNPLSSIESEQFPFPLNITELDLSWTLLNQAFLRNLRTLDMSLTDFTNETYQLILQSLDSLEKLSLSNVGRLDGALFNWACGIQTLQTLDLSFNGYLIVTASFGERPEGLGPSSLQMLTRLSMLNLGANSLTEVPLTIRNMSSLTSLSLHANKISELRCLDFSGLHLLKILNLSFNKFRDLKSCVFQDLQSLEKLFVQKTSILNLDDCFGKTLPNLLVLDAADNNIEELQRGVFSNMTCLKDLELQTKSVTEMLVYQETFVGLTDLRTLSMSPIFIFDPPSAGVGPRSSSRGRSQLQQVFNLPLLQTLRITVSKDVCVDLTKDLFKGLDDLKVLSWRGCFWNLFQPLTVLQTLDLSENHLKSMDFLSEANLTQLQTLIIKNNDMSVINERVFEALPSLRYLDLSDNPFVCNCSNADFIDWVIRNRQVYVNGAYQYRCTSLPSEQGALLLEFDYRWCWESVGFFCFICSSALVLLTLLLSFLHHFLRLHLLYGFYLLRAFLYHRQRQRGRGCAEIYDALCHTTSTTRSGFTESCCPSWRTAGWKLCLHHRDFEPGKAIMENIVDAIYSSRKTLCVISHQYLLSEWCSREIQMASFRLLDEQKDVLILLFLEELSSNQLSPFFRMRKLMRSRTYLSWSGARGHRGLFWERVRHALHHIHYSK